MKVLVHFHSPVTFKTTIQDTVQSAKEPALTLTLTHDMMPRKSDQLKPVHALMKLSDSKWQSRFISVMTLNGSRHAQPK